MISHYHIKIIEQMKCKYKIPSLPLSFDIESKEVLRQLNSANRKLAELRGIAQTIPNENILINTLALQEAKDSSEVENIITTQDNLYKAELSFNPASIHAAEKEVMNYREALLIGYSQVKTGKVLSLNIIKDIQQHLVFNRAGFRTVPGTTLKNDDGDIVYIPPQDAIQVAESMDNLEKYINDNSLCDLDPLIKMAIIHHQFESIHPFYDGNGRTGRIVLILYLVTSDLLDLPVLYLSRYITRNKAEYYRLLQTVRDNSGDNSNEWIDWVLFMLKGVEQTATETICMVKGMSKLMAEFKKVLRPLFGKQYRHELLNNLFFHPYTKVEFLERDMMITRQTAAKYLDRIVGTGLLTKMKIGKSNYYINNGLYNLFLNSTHVNE